LPSLATQRRCDSTQPYTHLLAVADAKREP